MAVEKFGNSGGEEVTPGQSPDQSLNPREIYSGQPSNQDGDLGRGEITSGQRPRDELGAGTVNYESEQTAAELMNQVLSLVRSGLREWLQGLEPKEKDLANLKSFLDTVVSGNTEGTQGTQGTAELETMIQEAFKYIQQFGIDNTGSRLLADFVVQIAGKLREAVYKIAFKSQFSYETRASALKGLISFVINLILNVGPEFRGREPAKADTDHPNNALLTTLDFAANVLLGEAASDPQKLIGAVSSLLEMTTELRSDERKLIYDGIRQKITAVMATRNIDDNLREQFDEIINQLVDQYQ